jgi:hypothetical protein
MFPGGRFLSYARSHAKLVSLPSGRSSAALMINTSYLFGGPFPVFISNFADLAHPFFHFICEFP